MNKVITVPRLQDISPPGCSTRCKTETRMYTVRDLNVDGSVSAHDRDAPWTSGINVSSKICSLDPQIGMHIVSRMQYMRS